MDDIITIVVEDVSVSLLREQQGSLISLLSDDTIHEITKQNLEGLLNLVDHMLDKAEGYISKL